MGDTAKKGKEGAGQGGHEDAGFEKSKSSGGSGTGGGGGGSKSSTKKS